MKKIALLIAITFFINACYKESFVPIEGDFNALFVDADESVPVLIKIDNKIKGADTYEWTFEGGMPSESSEFDPGEIAYDSAGTYTILLITQNQDGEKKEFKKTITIKDAININFTKQFVVSHYPPATVEFLNNTQGNGLTFNWEFEGGNPSAFSGKNPPTVVFAQAGSHNIKLTVSNGFESKSETQSITVAPDLAVDFSWNLNFEDQDYQSPVTINFINQTISATNYSWTFDGGNPSSAIDKDPSQIVFTTGTHQITLTASNDKTSQTISKTITVLPDTNLTIIENIKFGTNAAHNSNIVGSLYAIKNLKSYTQNQISNAVSGNIDIAFQGLNSNFSYNKFISPNQVENYGFQALQNAQNTIFINSQDLCNCGLNFTETDFDNMTNDLPLQNLVIPSSASGAQEFGFNFPKIILFKTQDGRKGAIKIKDMIKNGTASYILCDIKVQKQ